MDIDTRPFNECVSALLDQLRIAFSVSSALRQTDGLDEENDDRARFLVDIDGLNWLEMSCDIVEKHYDVLPFLEPGEYLSVIPAFIKCALMHFRDERNVRDFTVYSLCPTHLNPRIAERFNLLLPKQVEVIVAFLKLTSTVCPVEAVGRDALSGLETIWEKRLGA